MLSHRQKQLCLFGLYLCVLALMIYGIILFYNHYHFNTIGIIGIVIGAFISFIYLGFGLKYFRKRLSFNLRGLRLKREGGFIFNISNENLMHKFNKDNKNSVKQFNKLFPDITAIDVYYDNKYKQCEDEFACQNANYEYQYLIKFYNSIHDKNESQNLSPTNIESLKNYIFNHEGKELIQKCNNEKTDPILLKMLNIYQAPDLNEHDKFFYMINKLIKKGPKLLDIGIYNLEEPEIKNEEDIYNIIENTEKYIHDYNEQLKDYYSKLTPENRSDIRCEARLIKDSIFYFAKLFWPYQSEYEDKYYIKEKDYNPCDMFDINKCSDNVQHDIKSTPGTGFIFIYLYNLIFSDKNKIVEFLKFKNLQTI